MVNTMTLSRIPDNVINMKGLWYVVYLVYCDIGEFDLDLIQTTTGAVLTQMGKKIKHLAVDLENLRKMW
jgi:hypothetical protein